MNLGKPTNFRLKMKHSLKPEPISNITDELINKTLNNEFGLELNDIR